MQRRAIINQLREEGIKLSVTKFKLYLERLGLPLSGDYDFEDDQVSEIKATVRGDLQECSEGPEEASPTDLGVMYEKSEAAISTALEMRLSAIGAGIQAFDAKLTVFEEQAATAVVDRLNTSEARIMALVEARLGEQHPHDPSETRFNLALLVEEAMLLPDLSVVESPALLAHAHAFAH
ncbi:MAG: hypothetical protein AAF528_00145 [Cyanobacteria bacterium P01_C01_bin.121]